MSQQMDAQLNMKEYPIDLGEQIAKGIEAAEMLITALEKHPVSSETAGLLAETAVTRDHLILLRVHIKAAYHTLVIAPEDDDYLILQAINTRLDNALRRTHPAENAAYISLLLATIKKSAEIVDNLTAS